MQNKQTENTNIEERFGQAKPIQINKNRASKKKKRFKIVLPQHSKKQEKMTTKSKLEFFFLQIFTNLNEQTKVI